MPCSYTIHRDAGVIVLKYYGQVCTRDVLGVLDRIEHDPDFRHGMAEFGDLSDVETLRLGAGDIIKLAQILYGLYMRNATPARVVFWTPKDETYFPARRFCALITKLSRIEIAAFRDRDEALAFLEPALCAPLVTPS